MARAPDPRIEQAKAMYLKGAKLVEIASQLSLPEGTVRSAPVIGIANVRIKKANVRIKRKADNREIKMQKDMVGRVHRKTKMQRNMVSLVSISQMKHGRFFLPLNRQILLIYCGIRYRLPMQPLSGRRELHMSKIRMIRPSRR